MRRAAYLASAILLLLSRFASAAPAWEMPAPILDSAPCVTTGEDEARFRAETPARIPSELSRSGVTAAPPLDRVYPPARVAALNRAVVDGRCRRVHYRVDGMRVSGFVLTPLSAKAHTLPALIYARGGNRDFGKVDFSSLVLLQTFADAGFVVVTTQYRGVDGGDGSDEFGGDDVHDLEALFALVRGEPAYDGKRVYLYGHSRGGMETYEALRDGLPVRAAAVTSGIADLAHAIAKRPEMERVAAMNIPEWDTKRQQAIEHRSALRWADRLNTPLLILHTKQDWRVPVAEAQALDATLTRLGREHRLIVFDGDAHGIYLHRQAAIDAIVAWFRAH